MSTSSDLSLTVFLSYANMHFKMWDQGFALLFCRIKDFTKTKTFGRELTALDII